MRSRKFRALSIGTVLLMLGFLAFSAGCQGDKGKAGEAGPAGEQGVAGEAGEQGPPGPQLAAVGEETCSYCHSEGAIADVEVVHGLANPAGFAEDAITSINITFGNLVVASGTGNSSVTFTVKDQDGNGVAGLSTTTVTDRDLRFAIAQLTLATSGNSSFWENYVVTPDNEEPTYEGGSTSTSRFGSGTLTDNGAGSYTYNFKTDIPAGGNATTPITYAATKTQRVVIQSGGDLPSNQYAADYLPSGGATPVATDDGDTVTGTFARSIVNEASCNECHNPLSIHGSRRKTKYCQVCHAPQLENGEGDLKHFIHKIHRGRYLPSVVAGTPYVFPAGSTHDFSDVGFPMFPLEDGLGIQNCTKCHDGADAATPDGNNWKTVPTIEACGSCHDDVDFSAGIPGGHLGGVQTNNAGCAAGTCHGSSTLSPDVVHNVPANYAAALGTVAFNISSATYSASTGKVTVTFSFTDPSNSDAAWDIATDEPFNTDFGASVTLSVAWDSSTDFFNQGSGNTPARALDTSVTGAVGTSALTDNSDGTYTMVVTLPDEAQASGSGMVFLQGHPLGDIDGDGNIEDGEEMPTDSVSKFFAITDTSATARRTVADIDKCNSCHGRLALHGDNRTNNLNVCAACHNANHTDVNQRPDDASTTTDGKAEEGVDFKRLIHAVHASGMREEPIVIYGFGQREHVFDEEEVTFPGELNKCDACHESEAYWLPLADDILASTIDSGADVADPSDDLNITQSAAVCSSCHDSEKAATHMEQNGASFDVLDANIMFY